MAFGETKVYFDGCHYIAIPHTTRPSKKRPKPVEELVFSHGDYCMPNIFIKNNKINGFIDLGRSGVADKYQDIALCYRSLKHNFDGSQGGKVYENFNAESLFIELDIVPDWEKIKYYILMDELF